MRTGFFHRLFSCLLLAAAAGTARADDVLLFNNGDRLTGELIEETPETIRFRSPVLGELTVPAAEASVQPTAPPPAPAVVGAPAPETTDDKPAPAPAARDSQLKGFIERFVPSGWHGRIDVGLSRVAATSTTTQLNATGKIGTKQGANAYDFKAYYNYSATQDQAGVVSRSADKYGAHFDYARTLDRRWEIKNELDYLRDFQANINHQAQDTLGLSYKIWNTQALEITLLAGPTGRYVDAPGLTTRWYYLGTVKQGLVWRFLPGLRFEQEAAGYLDPAQTQNYAWKAEFALIHSVTDWLELSLRYRHAFNSIVGFNGEKTEESIALTLGLPF